MHSGEGGMTDKRKRATWGQTFLWHSARRRPENRLRPVLLCGERPGPWAKQQFRRSFLGAFQVGSSRGAGAQGTARCLLSRGRAAAPSLQRVMSTQHSGLSVICSVVSVAATPHPAQESSFLGQDLSCL